MVVEQLGAYDVNNAPTEADLIQARTDDRTASIRREPRKIEVISDEKWDQWVEEARKRRVAREKREADEKFRERLEKERKKVIEEQIKRYESRLARDIDRDRRHRLWYEAFLKNFHEPDEADEISAEIWSETYQRMSCFLTKIDATYNWREIEGPDLTRRLLAGGNRTTIPDINYFHGVVTRKDKGKEISYSKALETALEENLKSITRFLELSKRMTDPPDKNLIDALPAIAHLVNDNNPKDLADWKKLMRSGLDCKKHPKPPNMCWQLEEAFDQKIHTLEEAKLLKDMVSDPEFLPDYASLCARTQLLKDIIGSESIRLILEDTASLE